MPLLSADLADTLVELLQASTRLVLQVPAVQHSTASEQQEQAGAAADYATRWAAAGEGWAGHITSTQAWSRAQAVVMTVAAPLE